MHTILVILAFLLLGALCWIIYPMLDFKEYRNFVQNEDYVFFDGGIGIHRRKTEVSVVIPAFNEEDRLPPTMDDTIHFFEQWSQLHNKTYEIIVVDDGSLDKTLDIAIKYYTSNHHASIRIAKLIRNVGKARAVKLGVELALGSFILMADADGATDIRDFSRLFDRLKAEPPSSKYSC